MKRLLVTSVVVGTFLGAIPLLPGIEAAHAVSGTFAFSESETLSRDFAVNGVDSIVDSRNFTVNVAQTANLVGRQEIDVSWTGAHPTGGIVANQNSIDAQYEEYPVVVLECRGVDSASPPVGASQLTPETCWTQDWSERYQQAFGDPAPPWTLDEYATPAQTQAIVGAPAPLPASCTGPNDPYGVDAPSVQDWVPWLAADGTTYFGGDDGCAGSPPEADVTSALPSNETFGVSGTNGNGSAQFDVFTSQQNQTLGCSTTVACSLVVVPIMGVSCTIASSVSTTDASACEATGHYAPGAPSSGDPTLPQTAVTGSLWWSASNWRNRISVPLTFATTSSACSLTGTNATNSVDIYGSELMIRATQQWEPYFCLGDDNHDNFSVVHVETGEPEARNLVASGGAEAAFTELPQKSGYPVPTVNAPVAMTGFTIAYSISGVNGQQYANLRLTPLLLAKLLTESYPDITELTQAASSTGGVVDMPALANNPYNITEDPEFESLNPGVPVLPPDNDSAAELISLSSDSDVIQALTTYINDDPSARSWLDGTSSGEPNTCNSAGKYEAAGSDPCPAMAVNPAYKGIQLPVDQWPLLTPPDSPKFYGSSWMQNNNPCLASSYPPGIPYLGQVASPLASMEAISEDMQFDLPNSQVTCQQLNGSTLGQKLVNDPRQGAGNYFMLGITPLADDYVYGLQAAELQTSPDHFVGPSTTALQSAAALLQPDATTGTWPIPYDKFESSAGQSAYPGSMVVYLAVPTKGLPPTDAQDLGQILQFAATTGQQQGSEVGQLPPGYLPLTKANGLAALATYTAQSATEVTAQGGQVPPVPGSGKSGTSGSSTPAGASSTGAAVNGNSGSGAVIPLTDRFGNALLAGMGTVAASGSPKGSTAHLSVPIVAPLLPIIATAERLQAGWLTMLSGFSVLWICAAGLVGLPLLLLAGRRRGRW